MHIQRVKYKDIEELPQLQIKRQFKDYFFGSSPAPFIGRYGYPNVNIGVLSPQFSGDTSPYDSPRLWSANNFQIDTIAMMRYSLVNSRSTAHVKNLNERTSSRFLEIVQEVGMAKTSAELEIKLKSKPQLQLKPEREIIPFGPHSEMQQARITSNTKVDVQVDKVVSDTDLKAAPALIQLYKKGFEETALNKLISVGTLGLKHNRRLVPTRWSITAIDDTIGKNLIEEIKDLPAGDCQLYFSGGWGNYYLLLFFPEVWSYELFETYLDKEINPWSRKSYRYSTDYEDYNSRKTYAEECAGGYYAARLPILEKMKQDKRQFACLALRFITPEYNLPLGVWVCREACRKSTYSSALKFNKEEEMLKYAQELILKHFNFDLSFLIKESKLLKNRRQQRRLSEF